MRKTIKGLGVKKHKKSEIHNGALMRIMKVRYTFKHAHVSLAGG
jgi:hypothetical protein